MPKNKYKQLTQEQRYAIQIALKDGISKKDIAEKIGCHFTTVYREFNRNKSKRGKNNWKVAQECTNERRERNPKNKVPQYIQNEAIKLLKEEQWSPEQISNHLKIEKGYLMRRYIR